MQTDAVFENIAERIQTEIVKTKHTLLIAVAWFTNKNLFDSILDKAKEGCKVSLIISDDEINDNSGIFFSELKNHNGQFYRFGNGDAEFMHNKFCVIDNSTVITGSYNWSYKAENNFENIVINYDDKYLAEQFIIEFNSLIKTLNSNNVVKYSIIGLHFSEELSRFYWRNNKFGFVNKEGELVIPIKYQYAGNFSEGLAAAELNGKWGYIDKAGDVVIPFKYDSRLPLYEIGSNPRMAGNFSEGLAGVRLNGKWGYINKVGEVVIPFNFDVAYYFSEGLAIVGLNTKFGFVNNEGELVIPCKYSNADSFSDGLAQFELNGKWGFINKTGNEVIPLKYDYVWKFNKERAKVKLNKKIGYINKTGEDIIPCKYDMDYYSETYVDLKLEIQELEGKISESKLLGENISAHQERINSCENRMKSLNSDIKILYKDKNKILE